MFAFFSSLVLAAVLSTARAAEAPAAPPSDPAGPYSLAYTRSGDFVVFDVHGDELSTRRALETFAGPGVATSYARRRGARKAGAIALCVGGSVVTTGLLVRSPGGALLLGGGMVGAGFGVLYGPRSNRLDAWVDEASLRRQIEASHGRVATAEGLIGAESRVLGGRPVWEVSDDGKGVRLHGGLTVGVSEVAAVLGRPDVARQAASARRSSVLTGGGLAVAGSTVAVLGVWKAQSAYDSRLEAGGVATAVTGALAAGAGVVVMARASRLAVPGRWFTEGELQQAVEAHNAAYAVDTVAPARTPVFSVQPRVGLGYLGVTGTF